MSIGQKIEAACELAGIKLKPLCELAGVKYGTLHQQITRQSKIPFETVDAISAALKLPLEHFSDHPREVNKRERLAGQMMAMLDTILKEDAVESQSPDAAQLWAKLRDGDFRLDNLGELLPHCDIYYPLDSCDSMPHPESFGKHSLSRKFLKFDTKSDYYKRIVKFDEGVRGRSMLAHKNLEAQPFSVASEMISESIDGKVLEGCYLRAIAKVADASGGARTLVFTQFMGYGREQELHLATR